MLPVDIDRFWIAHVYRKKSGRQDFLNKEYLNKLAELRPQIAGTDFIADYYDLKGEIDDLAAKFCVSNHIINKGFKETYVSIVTDKNGERLGLEVQYYYGKNFQYDTDEYVGLVLTAKDCYAVYYVGDGSGNCFTNPDKNLTNMWHEILAKKYGTTLKK